MKNKKGFTLIELLAVIVILAIIALIATPIIMNVINDSKKGAAKDSMYAYIKGIELAVAKKIDSGTETLRGSYITKDGDLYSAAIKVLAVDMKGDKPLNNGIVILKNGQVAKAELTFNGFLFKYEGTVAFEKYNVGDTIYFDPTGVVADCNIGKEWTVNNPNTTCYKWNVVKNNRDNVEMLLNHNTTAVVSWNSSGSNETGPKEVYDKLKIDTNGWSKVEIFTSSDNVTRIAHDGIKYTINYDGLRARLIAGQEIADIGNDSQWTPSNYTGTKYLDSSWLYSNLSISNTNLQPYGYWTDTTSTVGNSNAWRLNYDSYLHNTLVNDSSRFGLRPIVRVLKINL